MAENLNVAHYQNGDPIPRISKDSEWSALKSGAYCNYENDYKKSIIYGKLYNWYAVNDNRKLAPAGWHVPTDEEWNELETYLGRGKATGHEADQLKEKGTSHWDSPNEGATNKFGFTALPGGYGQGHFNHIGNSAYFWTSIADTLPNKVVSARFRKLSEGIPKIEHGNLNAGLGYSVRCVKD